MRWPFIVEGDILVTSLMPLLCAEYPLEAAEDNVLLRLSSKILDGLEHAVDAVEALEGSRFTAGYPEVGTGRRE